MKQRKLSARWAAIVAGKKTYVGQRCPVHGPRPRRRTSDKRCRACFRETEAQAAQLLAEFGAS